MTTIENSGSTEMTRAKTPWIRRTVMGTAIAAAAMVTLAGTTKPAEAYWYNGYWYPNYVAAPYYAYNPYGYGYYYHPPYYHVGWGWGWHGGWGGWHGGWGHGWHH